MRNPKHDPAKLATILRTALRRKDISQRRLAKRAGVAPSYVSKILNPPALRPARPTEEVLSNFADVLGIGRGHLLAAAGYAHPTTPLEHASERVLELLEDLGKGLPNTSPDPLPAPPRSLRKRAVRGGGAQQELARLLLFASNATSKITPDKRIIRANIPLSMRLVAQDEQEAHPPLVGATRQLLLSGWRIQQCAPLYFSVASIGYLREALNYVGIGAYEPRYAKQESLEPDISFRAATVGEVGCCCSIQTYVESELGVRTPIRSQRLTTPNNSHLADAFNEVFDVRFRAATPLLDSYDADEESAMERFFEQLALREASGGSVVHISDGMSPALVPSSELEQLLPIELKAKNCGASRSIVAHMTRTLELRRKALFERSKSREYVEIRSVSSIEELSKARFLGRPIDRGLAKACMTSLIKLLEGKDCYKLRLLERNPLEQLGSAMIAAGDQADGASIALSFARADVDVGRGRSVHAILDEDRISSAFVSAADQLVRRRSQFRTPEATLNWLRLRHSQM